MLKCQTRDHKIETFLRERKKLLVTHDPWSATSRNDRFAKVGVQEGPEPLVRQKRLAQNAMVGTEVQDNRKIAQYRLQAEHDVFRCAVQKKVRGPEFRRETCTPQRQELSVEYRLRGAGHLLRSLVFAVSFSQSGARSLARPGMSAYHINLLALA